MTGPDPDAENLEALARAAGGDPAVEAALRMAYTERSAAVAAFHGRDHAAAVQHNRQARQLVMAVLTEQFGPQPALHATVLELEAMLLEEAAQLASWVDTPREEVVELLETAITYHQLLDQGSAGEVRCLGALADLYRRTGDDAAARTYFRRALELQSPRR